jgi:hypothetical protein
MITTRTSGFDIDDIIKIAQGFIKSISPEEEFYISNAFKIGKPFVAYNELNQLVGLAVTEDIWNSSKVKIKYLYIRKDFWNNYKDGLKLINEATNDPLKTYQVDTEAKITIIDKTIFCGMKVSQKARFFTDSGFKLLEQSGNNNLTYKWGKNEELDLLFKERDL